MTTKISVLVVDDELPVCKSIAAVMDRRRFAVQTALSGEEALSMLPGLQPQIMIIDLMMPGISGMELLELVKQQYPDTTVIMVTGYPSIKSAVQAVKLGAFDYLPKPFTPMELRNLVSRALERRRLSLQAEPAAERGQERNSSDLYGIPEHSWVLLKSDKQAVIGMHHILTSTIEQIRSLDIPAAGVSVYQGEAFARITDARKRVHRLWAPLSGRITAVNDAVKGDPGLLMRSPYDQGWLICIAPMNLEKELANLKRL